MTSELVITMGQIPTDAFFQAETSCLLRAARANGDTLAGESLEIHCDRAISRGCQHLLPLIGLQLGNPTVTFIDPLGSKRTMRDGDWARPNRGGKSAYFDSHDIDGWPEPRRLERFFLAPPGERWFCTGGNDTAGFTAEGVHFTQHLKRGKGRIDLRLDLWGNPDLGVLLIYSKAGGDFHETYTSNGDMSRLHELVRSLHDTPLPVGLFIPFDRAWLVVKEFIETNGKLPKSIAWVANETLPHETFPDP